jgi:hypothetical protein
MDVMSDVGVNWVNVGEFNEHVGGELGGCGSDE